MMEAKRSCLQTARHYGCPQRPGGLQVRKCCREMKLWPLISQSSCSCNDLITSQICKVRGSNFLPLTAHCQTHSWAWANISHSRLFTKSSVRSKGVFSESTEGPSLGSADMDRKAKTPAAFFRCSIRQLSSSNRLTCLIVSTCRL